MYERQNRERRQAEADAKAERAGTIRELYIGAAIVGAGAVVFIGVVLFGHWSRANLVAKGEEALLAAVLGAIAYALFRQARRMQPPPSR
jgi:hypothetical protein